jgi:PAS domain S-box-containing protein
MVSKFLEPDQQDPAEKTPDSLPPGGEVRMLRDVLDSLYTFTGLLTPDGIMLEANQAALRGASLAPEDVIGKPFPETYWWSYSPEVQAQLRDAISRAACGEYLRYDVKVRLDDDRFIDVDFALAPLFDDAGKVTYLIPSGIDITRRKRIEEALREREAQFASVIGSAMDAIITVDPDQRIVLFNAAAEKMFDSKAEEARGQDISRFIPGRYREAHREHIRKFGRHNATKRSMGNLGAIFGLRADGVEFPIEASISHADVSGHKLYTVIIRDITERKKAEDQMREQAALLDRAHDAILVRNLEDRVLFWNHGAERLYGWKSEDAVGRDVRELFYRADAIQYEQAKKHLLEHDEWEGELRQITRDGKQIVSQSRWTLVRDDHGLPSSVLVIDTDISDKKRIEAQFLRAQRMESIGTLAGGIAHDFNNLLSPILISIRLLEQKVPDEDSQRILATLQTSVERAASLVKQVLSFARGVEGERLTLQPRHLIRELVKILQDTLPKSISVSFKCAEDLWTVMGDPTQLHQVMMNLCVNARDAMPDGGDLTIGAENVTIDEPYARMNLEARPGHFVLITIADTGAGISSQVVDKIFEPFFTTKEHGKGTGLGLSTALGIVKGHSGFINVYSEPGRKTQFNIYLPASGIDQLKSRQPEESHLPTGHGELILLVDDEQGVLEITRRTLEAYGYRALTASDGTEAVALFAQHKDEVKVVVTDMMMPYMDGPATIRALQKISPRVQIIATSGFTDDHRAAEASGNSVRKFLSKPYTADKLLKALAEILGSNQQ